MDAYAGKKLPHEEKPMLLTVKATHTEQDFTQFGVACGNAATILIEIITHTMAARA